MKGYRFREFKPAKAKNKAGFEDLLNLFMQLMVVTSGDVSEALSWLNELDQQHGLTGDNYGIGDFIEDLKKKGYLEENTVSGSLELTAKSEQKIRRSALEEIFGKLKKSGKGEHHSRISGLGEETGTDQRPFEFGDAPEQIAYHRFNSGTHRSIMVLGSLC